MKKILLLILILTICVFNYGQSGGSGTKVSYEEDKLTNMKSGIFNVLDYGATNGGSNNDAVGFRAAVTAAEAYVGTYYGDGIVYCPPGAYDFTDSVELKSNVTIQGYNAVIYTADNYMGCVFSSQSGVLRNSALKGFTLYLGYRDAVGLRLKRLVDINNYVGWNDFTDMVIHGAKTAIELTTNNNGWINTNLFRNLKINDCVNGIWTVDLGNNDIGGNIFENITFQATSNVLFNIKDFTGQDNDFKSIFMWDMATGAGLTFDADGQYNHFDGGYVTSVGFSDSSAHGNYINTGNDWLKRTVVGEEQKHFDIGYPGSTGYDFKFALGANHTAQNLDLGAIIPRNSKVTDVQIICRIPPNYPSSTQMSFAVGNASAGEQFIASTRCDGYLEALGITNSALPLAVDIDYGTATHIWVQGDPASVNWTDMIEGLWEIYITYVKYPFE